MKYSHLIIFVLFLVSLNSAREGSYILRGDVNWDGVVNAVDGDLIKQYLAFNYTIDPLILGDVNGDGIVSLSDVIYLQRYFQGIGPAPVGDYYGIKGVLMRGDLNWDGKVDSADQQLLTDYMYNGGPAPNPMILGDIDGDGIIDMADLTDIIGFRNYGYPIKPIYRGDLNWDGTVDQKDLDIMLAYQDSAATIDPLILGDFDGDQIIDISDITQLESYLRIGAPLPVGPIGNPNIPPTPTPTPIKLPSPSPSIASSPSPTPVASSTPVPTVYNPPTTGSGRACSVKSDCTSLGSGFYCEAGTCTTCSFACVADNICVSCCAKAGRVDPDCGPIVSPTPTPTPRRPTATPVIVVSIRPTPIPTPIIKDDATLKIEITNKLNEAKQSGANTQNVENILKTANDLEQQGKKEEAKGFFAQASAKLDDTLAQIKKNKALLAWALAIVILVFLGGAAIYHTLTQAKNAEEKEQAVRSDSKAPTYESAVSDDLTSIPPVRPINIDLKKRKLDIK